MSRRWLNGQSGEQSRTGEMTVSDTDVEELCLLGTDGVRALVAPNTTRIGQAFDGMMSAVKRRSCQRHQDTNTAIERCFEAFAGRRKTSVGVREFAKRLSTLSIQWSGRYTKEEYRALAQAISENDTPGIVTLDSFLCAAHAGSLNPSPARGRGGDNRNNRGAERNTQFAGDCSNGAERCEVEEFQDDQAGDDGGSVAGGESLRGTKPGRGGESTASSREVVEAVLKRAASEARSAGKDVWKLLDDAILASVETETDDATLTSEDAARTSLTPEALRHFFSEIRVRIVSSSSPSAISERGEGARAVNQHTEGGNPKLGLDSPACEAGSSSLPWGGALDKDGGRTREVQMSTPQGTRGSVAGSYLQAISRETAAVRCRVQHYNRELARTWDEAEALISQVGDLAPRDSSSPKSSSVSQRGGSVRHRSFAADKSDGSSETPLNIWATGNGDDCSGDSVGPGRTVAKVASANGVRGSTFCRVSPAARADPSHPRVDLKLRKPCGTEKNPVCPSNPSRTDQEHRPRVGDAPAGPGGSGGVGDAGEKRERVAALLLAAVAARGGGSSKGTTPTPAASGKTGEGNDQGAAVIGDSPTAARTAACFDPPSVRNGFTGLTTEDVDKILLQVEASAPGSISCWKSPERARRPEPLQSGSGNDSLLPWVSGWNGVRDRQQRRSRSALDVKGSEGNDEETGPGREGGNTTPWERLQQVIRAPPTARPPLPADKNAWDTERMKWVGPHSRSDLAERFEGFTPTGKCSSPFTITGEVRSAPSTPDAFKRSLGSRTRRGYDPLNQDMYESFLRATKGEKVKRNRKVPRSGRV